MTKEEIYSAILTEHDKEAAIKKIPARATSDTLGAIYRSVSAGMKVFSDSIDNFLAWFELYRDTAVSPSKAWMGWKATQYQHGDSLIFSNGIMVYPAIDDSKKIIHVASVSTAAGQTYCKAAKLNEDSGLLEQLTEGESTGLESYMRKIIPADTYLLVVRPVAVDELVIEADIYVDATKISTNGAASYDNNVYPIVDAINVFLASYSNLNDFGSILYATELESAIKSTSGVKNVVLKSLKSKVGTVYYDILSTVSRSYEPNCGFFVLNLSESMLSYKAQW